MNGSRALGALLIAACLACGAPSSAQAQAASVDVSLAINAPGSGNWLIYIAQQAGFFRDEGLHVDVVTSGSNTNTINLLATGGTNFGLDGSDIEIEAIAHGLPVKIVAPEFGPNPYTLVTVPSVTSWDQLKGKTVVLGAKQDVSSLTFFRVAEAAHLRPDDFTIVTSASSSSRYAALLSGNVQATVLSQPFDILAQEHGLHALAYAADSIKSWMDTCFAVNATWAALPGNHATVVRFVRALRKAVQYGYAHPDEAIAALVAGTNIAQSTAQKAYDLDFRTRHTFDRDQRLDVAGLSAMSAMLVRQGAIASPPRLEDVLDPSYMKEAARR